MIRIYHFDRKANGSVICFHRGKVHSLTRITKSMRLSKKDAADEGSDGNQRKDHNQKRKRLDAGSLLGFHNMIW